MKGELITNKLYDINDSETIMKKIINPSLDLYRKNSRSGNVCIFSRIFGAKGPREFIEMHWKAEWLREYGLPDIGYPMPNATGEVLNAEGEIGFAQILFWLQDFSAERREEWQKLEPAMQRLTELLAPDDSREC